MVFRYKIRSSDYQSVRENLKSIDFSLKKYKSNKKTSKSPTCSFYLSHHDFPTVDDLSLVEIDSLFKDIFPYLLFYKDFYEDDSKEFLDTKAFLEDYFEEHLVVIPDIYYERLENVSLEDWLTYDVNKKVDVFSSIMSYYEPNEFHLFLEDLSWLPLLRVYIKKDYFEKEHIPRFAITEFKEIWDTAHHI